MYHNQGEFHDGGLKSAIKKFTNINNDYSRWIMSKSQRFTKQGLYMLSDSVRAYVYLILSSQANARFCYTCWFINNWNKPMLEN